MQKSSFLVGLGRLELWKLKSKMKIFIFFLILILNTFCNYSFSAEVNKKDLNEFYNGCLDNAKRSDLHEEGLKICNCAINIISTQLSNEEFQRIFSGDQKTTDAWMREYLEPNCNFRRS